MHRDIKPDNIWVPDDVSLPPFYLDFGISAKIGERMEYRGHPNYRPWGTSGRKGLQTPELNYFALNKIFSDAPLNDPHKPVKPVKPGNRYTRRRRNRRSKN